MSKKPKKPTFLGDGLGAGGDLAPKNRVFLTFFGLSRDVVSLCVYINLFLLLMCFVVVVCILLMSHKMVEKRVFFRGPKRGRKRPVFGVFFGSLFSCHSPQVMIKYL